MSRPPVYLVFGSGGIIGKAFSSKFGLANYRLFEFDHKKADITDPNHITPLLEYIRPTAVINCAAINDEDLCQEAKVGAFSVNCRGPQLIAEACQKYHCKFVNFSSVTVFDGKRCMPYTERHAINPINIHGQSKVAGEDTVRKATDDYLIIRPGWVFSYDNPSFIPYWISQAEKQEEIAVLEDHHGSPTYVVDLIDTTLDLISHDAKGIFHVANSNAASRQSLAEMVLDITKLKTKITVVKSETQKFFKAPTPKNTILSTKKCSQLIGKEIRSWQDAIKHCLFTMQKYNP